MKPRIAMLMLATVLGQSGALAVTAPSGAAAPDPITITKISRAFSPNSDGDHDVATVRYALPAPGMVSVKVADSRRGKVVFKADLGLHWEGAYRWTWDGRTTRGARLRDTTYYVTMRTASASDREWTEIDRKFHARVMLEETYGQPRKEIGTVYPRTTVVRDALGLTTGDDPSGYRKATLLVRNLRGKVVARRNLVRHPTGEVVGGVWHEDPMMWEARNDNGRPLPAGRYEAQVRGVDRLGNAGSGTWKSLPIRVSKNPLEWVEETRTVSPEAAAIEACSWSGANGACDSHFWECGTVTASARFVGGMSHRSGVCEGGQTVPVAEKDYYVPLPEAVRGLESMRIAFTGTPTAPGESDLGRLAYYDHDTQNYIEVASSTGGQTPWIRSWMGMGQQAWGGREPRVPVSAVWSFRTKGTDSFDIEQFTVDLRYLARVAE